MEIKANSRNVWILSLFALVVFALFVVTGCDDDDDIVAPSTGPEVTWTLQLGDTSENILHAVYFVDGQHGWAVGDMGTILSYDANGLCIDTLISINTITPDSAETTITIDTNFNDCRWAAMGSGTTKSLRDVFFLDASYGWAVGLDGYILSTTDGGQTWAVDSMYVVCQAGKERILHDFNTVFFVNHGSGWAAGENGIGYRFVADSTCIDTFFAIDTTIDTFMVWDTAVTTIDTIPVDTNVVWDTTVYFPDSTIITSDTTIFDFYDTTFGAVDSFDMIDTIFADSDTTAYETQDGWFQMPSEPGVDIRDIFFIDEDDGWAVGDLGMIYHTSDGGVNWNQQKTEVSRTLRAVQFMDLNTGWVVGYDGLIMRTVDGGETWHKQFLGSGLPNHFVAMSFTDAYNGWVANTSGDIYRTVNGGLTWVRDFRGFDRSWNGVSFTDETTGWAVGFDGRIIHAEMEQ